MTRIHINASTPYDVVIEEGALQRITDYIKPLKTKLPCYYRQRQQCGTALFGFCES